jgi:hypothetical protein
VPTNVRSSTAASEVLLASASTSVLLEEPPAPAILLDGPTLLLTFSHRLVGAPSYDARLVLPDEALVSALKSSALTHWRADR